jgi:hypothetical protein
MINGRKGKSHTGNGLLKDDDWPHLLQLLDAKGALARWGGVHQPSANASKLVQKRSREHLPRSKRLSK